MNPAQSASAAQDGQDALLALDLGVNSVGWCLLKTPDGAPAGLVAAGCRIFEAGMEGDIAAGKGESHGLQRRQARAARRTLERRARRLRKLLHILQAAGLLPPGNAAAVLPDLDRKLFARYAELLASDDPARHQLAHVLPYRLRKEALDRRLEPHELGRALYHLGQRRGFLSNRLAPRKKDEEAGKVEEGIQEITRLMAEGGSRTLGEYFAGLDPHPRRIRSRWTARAMYQEEFEAIWTAQAAHHPAVLTDDLKKQVRAAMFFQRPLRSAAALVGACALEPKRKRAPQALLIAQRIRLLQQVNNCKVIMPPPDGEERAFTPDERAKLIDLLGREGDLTFAKAKKKGVLALPTGALFTLERGDEKRFTGNRTNAKLAKVFGERWWTMTPAERDQVVEDLRSMQNAEALARRGREDWGLSKEAAAEFAEIELEPGYAALSRHAMGKLLPNLEAGIPYATAVKDIYGRFALETPTLDALPRVEKFRQIRNPVVSRVLTEMRKVINAVVARYGKPGLIRIELARDMRRTQQERKRITKQNRQNEGARDKAKVRLLREAGIQNPRPDDILKVLLAEECNWECPYTGRVINVTALLGETPSFDIDHIIPFSRCLDDSYMNKTLCYHEENRTIKTNRTPWEAYGPQKDRWEQILQRVKRFQGDAAREKLRRFQLTEDEIESLEDFTSTQLNDTRYASRLACEYLACLYGGYSDAGGTRRIQASKGGVTKYIRQALGLNAILGESERSGEGSGGGPPGEKSRADHRHHAVDAVAIGLATPALIKALSDAAVQAWQRRGKRRHFEDIQPPWPGFLDDVRNAIDNLIVSHRASHKVNGPLHKETNYARVKVRDPETGLYTALESRVRKPLSALKPTEVDQIADARIRQIVKDALEKAALPPKEAFANPANDPCLQPNDPAKRPIPIHSVRIRCSVNPVTIGKRGRERHVATESNHHLEIYAVLDPAGNETKWEGKIVSQLDAMTRKRDHLPIVQRDHGPNTRFKFTLAGGDTIRFARPRNEPGLAVVKSISEKEIGSVGIEFVDIRDARKKKDIKKARARPMRAPDKLRDLGCQKVTVTPLGEVRVAND